MQQSFPATNEEYKTAAAIFAGGVSNFYLHDRYTKEADVLWQILGEGGTSALEEEDVATLSGFIQKIQGECTARHRNSDTSVPTQMALITYGETVNPRILLQLVNKVQEIMEELSIPDTQTQIPQDSRPESETGFQADHEAHDFCERVSKHFIQQSSDEFGWQMSRQFNAEFEMNVGEEEDFDWQPEFSRCLLRKLRGRSLDAKDQFVHSSFLQSVRGLAPEVLSDPTSWIETELREATDKAQISKKNLDLFTQDFKSTVVEYPPPSPPTSSVRPPTGIPSGRGRRPRQV